jgi:hypothetical protein
VIIENVTFSPASVVAGNSFTIGFDVRNTGPGNAPPTQARLRLSADNTLTSSDLPLSPLDINIPAVATGNSTHFSGTIKILSTTPQGLYYVGVFADWDNRANQSNVTNDAGLSASKLTVIGTGVAPPTIVEPPQSRTVNAADNTSFTVLASGAGQLKYQWTKDGQPILGATSNTLDLTNISTLQSGSYAALVSNLDLGGTAGTTPAILTVIPKSVPPPTTESSVGQFQCRPDVFDQELPTVLITHGWQPSGDFDPLNPVLGWMDKMANAIDDRLRSEGLRLSGTSNRRANICFSGWLEAFTRTPFDIILDLPQLGGLFVARSFVPNHGNFLAGRLNTLFPAGYENKFHIIGHSFGSLINAMAVNRMNRLRPEIFVDQFTILDAPDIDGGWNPALFHYLLPDSSSLGWVDNYYGDCPYLVCLSFLNASFGAPIFGTAPNSGLQVSGNHSDVHDRYCETIETDDGTCNVGDTRNWNFGFKFSALINNDPLPQEWKWKRSTFLAGLGSVPIGTIVADLVTETGGVWLNYAGVVNEVTDAVSGQARKVFQFIKSTILPQQQRSPTRALVAVSASSRVP